MRSALPSRSPTTRLSWAAATRRRAIAHQNTAMVDDAVLENPTVTTTIERSADPGAARAALERLLEIRPDLAEPLLDDEHSCARRWSRSRARRDRSPPRSSPIRSSSTCSSTRPILSTSGPRSGDLPGELGRGARRRRDDPLRVLRRWKRREFLRIAARDLLGIAALPVVARELAALADACLTRALDIADAPGSVPRRRDGQARRTRAELRERRRRVCSSMPTAPTARGRARRPGGDDGDDRADRRRHRVPDRCRPPPRGTLRAADAQPRQLRVLLRPVGPELGVPGAHQGPARRRRRRAGTSLHGHHRAPRVARGARPGRRPRGAGDEGARRSRDGPEGSRRPRAQARAGRDPRHRVRGPAPATRPRPPRRVDPVRHDAGRARATGGRRLRRVDRTPTASPRRTSSSGPSSTASSSGTSSRRTRCRRIRRPASASPASWATAIVRTGPPSTPSTRTIDRTRARSGRSTSALFFAPGARHARGRRSPHPGSRGGAARRVRVRGRPPDRRRAPRADERVRPHVARDAAAPPGRPRLALVDARSRSRAAAAAQARRDADARRQRGGDLPRLTGCRRSGCAASSGRAASSATRCCTSPTSSTSWPTTPISCASVPGASSSTRRWRRCSGARTSNSDAQGSGGSSGASSCASRRATSSDSRPPRSPDASSPRSRTHASRPP